MDRTGEDAAAKFINALIKSVQTLCHGYLDFENGVEIIGHINLSVDRGGSLDYILKEKVCKNAENSTMFISDSFHAEPRPDQMAARNSSLSDFHDVQHGESPDLGESGRVSSAISSISSSLSASRGRQRQSLGRSHSPHAHHRTGKRKLLIEMSDDLHPAKVSYMSTNSSYHGNATTETLLPQTATVTDHSDIGVNLAGSVLEAVGNQDRDDDSDDGLEVRFVKEEYTEKERSSCDFDNSTGHQFGGGTHHRGRSSSSASATFPSSGTVDRGTGTPQYISPESQAGPSGMRGVSGVQGFVHSLSAFGSMGATGLPLGQICGSRGEDRTGMADSKTPGFIRSHSSLQRAFALHSEDKRRRQVGERDDEIKQRLELMSELLALKGVTSSEDVKVALQREKRRVAKKMYRATLPENKRVEIKEKDKIHKRLKRATRWAASASMADASAQLSHDSSDMTPGKDFEGAPPHSSPGSVGSYAGLSSEYTGDVSDKGEGLVGNASRMGSDSSAMVQSRGGSESAPPGRDPGPGLGPEPVGCYTGMDSGSIPRLGPSSLGNIPRLGPSSLTSFPRMGTESMDSYPSMVPSSVSTAGMVFGSGPGVSWMDSMSFDSDAQGQQRRMEPAASPRDGPADLNQRGNKAETHPHPDPHLLSFTQAFQSPYFSEGSQPPPTDVVAKAFQCNMCNYSVDRSDSLKRHMRLHTGNLLRCEMCGQQYNSKHNLVSHQKKKHGMDDSSAAEPPS